MNNLPPRKIRRYLEQLGSNLKLGSAQRRRILTEVGDHLLGRVDRERAAGVSSDLAQEKAIAEFGDPGKAALRFNPSPASMPSRFGEIAPQSRSSGFSAARLKQSRAIPLIYGGVAAILLLVIAAMALILVPPSPPQVAEFAPQAQEQIDDALDSQSTQFGSGNGSCALGQVCDETAAAQASSPTRRVVEKARVRRCVGTPPRQTEDPQSPPCVNYWEGNNGGTTTPGVTRDEIRVAYVNGNTTFRPFADFFNRRFEFYGRKIVQTPYPQGQCDAEGAAATAEHIASLKVFAAMTDCVEQPMLGRELARRRIVAVPYQQDAVQQTELLRHAPYLWSYSMPVDELYVNFVAFACNGLAGARAAHAGPELSTQQRAFALFVAKNETHPVSIVVDGLSRCDSSPVAVIEVDGFSNQNDRNVELAVARARAEGATSLVCLCHGFVHLSAAMNHAQQQGYRPEWVMPGLVGQEFVRRAGSAPFSDQRNRLFGLWSSNKMLARADRPSAQALAEVGATGHVDTEVRTYQALLVLASGIQMAGANLTPFTFASGLQRTKFHNPGAGGPPYYQAHVGFGPGDHSMVDDVAMVWLDQTRGDPEYDQNASSSSFCYLDRGARWSRGSWPTEDRGFFDRTKPCR